MTQDVIFFDTETNGLLKCDSVLSISALKIQFTSKVTKSGQTRVTSREVDRYVRYYFLRPGEKINPDALRANGLTRDVLKKKRAEQNAAYPLYFPEDPGFQDFCKGVTHFVGHNISFDAQFLSFPLPHTFCTERTNTDIVGLFRKNGAPKWPSLRETLDFYHIPYDDGELHDSTYDTVMTYQVFKKMLKRKGTREMVRGFLESNRETKLL